jgi:hypothetical protein
VASFNFDYSPGDIVYVVIDEDSSDASISVKQARIIENRAFGHLNSDSTVTDSLNYLVLLLNDSVTKVVELDKVFETKESALDYIRGELEITPTPTPTPSATSS